VIITELLLITYINFIKDELRYFGSCVVQ